MKIFLLLLLLSCSNDPVPHMYLKKNKCYLYRSDLIHVIAVKPRGDTDFTIVYRYKFITSTLFGSKKWSFMHSNLESEIDCKLKEF